MKPFEERIKELQKIIDNNDSIVFFGGAGVSTESGIPDFRSKDGLYNQKDVRFEQFSPEYLLSHTCLEKHPKVFFEFYKQKMDVRTIEPNITHVKLAEMEANGKDITIVTQNIDGLHQKAGSKNVLEIHGTTMRNYCNHCHKEYPSDYIFNSTEDIPICPDCGKGVIRPDVTLYEESLPDAYAQAEEIIGEADTLIVAGTSLCVYPAAWLVKAFQGNNIVLINRTDTDMNILPDLTFKESMGSVFSQLK